MATIIRFLKLQNKNPRPVFYSLSFTTLKNKNSDVIPLGIVMPNEYREYDLSKDLLETYSSVMDKAQIIIRVRSLKGKTVSYGTSLAIGFESMTQAAFIAGGNALAASLDMTINGMNVQSSDSDISVGVSSPQVPAFTVNNQQVNAFTVDNQQVKTAKTKNKLVSRVSWRKSAEGFSRYVRQLDEYLATSSFEVPEMYDPSHVVGGTGVAEVKLKDIVINKVVLNSPKLTAGEKINFDYSVKDGPVTVEWVSYVRKSDNRLIDYKKEFPAVTAGTYTVHVYLYQKDGYAFKDVNGRAVCDVLLADCTKLNSIGRSVANGKNCYHFSYDVEVKTPNVIINRVVLNAPKLTAGGKMSFDYTVKEGAVTIESITYIRSSDNKYFANTTNNPIVSAGEKYTVHVYLYQKSGYMLRNGCEVLLADGTKLASSSSVRISGKDCCHFYYDVQIPSATVAIAGAVRYVSCTNNGAFVAALRVYYQKPGSSTWLSTTSGTFANGGKKTYDLVSELNLPLNTLVQVEVVVSAGRNNKSSSILKVDTGSTKTANFTCSGTTLSNNLTMNIVAPASPIVINKVVLNAPKLTVGEKINFDYTVKDGPVTVEWVSYVRKSDNRSINYKKEFPEVTAGTYTVHVYLYQKDGYAFKDVNGSAVCDVLLADGTKLVPSSRAVANGKHCYHFSYDVVVSSPVITDSVRYVSCTNSGAFMAALRIYYQKPGTSTWLSTTSGTFSVGNKKTYDLVSELGLPSNTLVQVEVVVSAGQNNKSRNFFKVDTASSKTANFTCSGTALNNSLTVTVVAPASPTIINKVVLNAPPKLKSGDKINFDYTVKEGPVTVEWVMFVRASDNRYIRYKQEYPVVAGGEKYTVHVYLYQKSGYAFREVNGNAVCDVMLADGTKLVSSSHMTANGKNCCHFSYEMTIPSDIAADHVRYITCTNRGGYVAKLRVHYKKPGSTSWESTTSGSFALGGKKTYDLVSELNLPLNTMVQVEVVVTLGKNNKSSNILRVHPGTTKTANFTCSGTTLSNKLSMEIK